MSMSASLFHTSIPVLEFIIRGAAVYLFVLFMLRLGGKRQLAQMSPTEFVAVLLISNAVQNSMNGGDNSVTGGFVLAIVLIILSTAISYLTYRSKKFSHIFEGTPTLFIYKGKVIEANLKKERVTRNEFNSMLRRQNVAHYSEVHQAVLEPDGGLTLVLKAELKNLDSCDVDADEP